jgi:hypothetical protein
LKQKIGVYSIHSILIRGFFGDGIELLAIGQLNAAQKLTSRNILTFVAVSLPTFSVPEMTSRKRNMI